MLLRQKDGSGLPSKGMREEYKDCVIYSYARKLPHGSRWAEDYTIEFKTHNGHTDIKSVTSSHRIFQTKQRAIATGITAAKTLIDGGMYRKKVATQGA